MDGGPLLVNDFLSHSERIYVGEGPESIEPLNGKFVFISYKLKRHFIISARFTLHGFEKWFNCRT